MYLAWRVKVGVCYIRGSRAPTGVSSYPGVYHGASTPVWGMLYPGNVSLLVLAPTLMNITVCWLRIGVRNVRGLSLVSGSGLGCILSVV